MSTQVLYFQNDNLLKLTGLKDAASGGAFQNSATVTAQVKDAAGANVGSSITLTYVTLSNGDYEGTVPDDIAVTQNTGYTVEVTATSSGLKGFWVVPLRVVQRTVE